MIHIFLFNYKARDNTNKKNHNLLCSLDPPNQLTYSKNCGFSKFLTDFQELNWSISKTSLDKK